MKELALKCPLCWTESTFKEWDSATGLSLGGTIIPLEKADKDGLVYVCPRCNELVTLVSICESPNIPVQIPLELLKQIVHSHKLEQELATKEEQAKNLIFALRLTMRWIREDAKRAGSRFDEWLGKLAAIEKDYLPPTRNTVGVPEGMCAVESYKEREGMGHD